MCNKIEIVENFINQYEIILSSYDKAKNEQGEIDREISSFYHKLEGTTLGATYKSHNLLKELKVLLERRRVNKIDVIVLRSTCDTIGKTMETLKTNKKRLLNKNTEILAEIVERAK